MTTGKTIALIRCTFVGKVMSLFFNMLSRLVITFLPRSKHLLIWETIRLNKISGFVETENFTRQCSEILFICSWGIRPHLWELLWLVHQHFWPVYWDFSCSLLLQYWGVVWCLGIPGSQEYFQTEKNWDVSKFKPMYNASSNIRVWVMNGEVMKK